MKHLLAAAIAAAVCAFLAGCSVESKPPVMAYKDSRSVTTRPAAASGKNADVLVRVRELQTGREKQAPGDARPADAIEVASTELVAAFGTPYYVTVGLPDQRFELGGIVTRLPNGTYRVQTDYMHHIPGGGIGVGTLQEMPLGETRILMGGLGDGGQRLITLVLEPLK